MAQAGQWLGREPDPEQVKKDGCQSTFGDPGSQLTSGDLDEVLEMRGNEPKKAGEPAAFILGEALPVVPAA